MKIVFSEKGEAEQSRLGVDLKPSVAKAIKIVPGVDLVGLSQILVTDLPDGKRKERNVRGSYFPKHENRPATVELYLKHIFGHIHKPENFTKMRPIWEIGLAQTLFHEIGHHVREIRTHGIKASENEGFAERYALKSLDKYYLENERSINDFFTKLEQVVSNGGGDPKIVKSMREGWDRDLEAARTRSTES